MPRTIDQMVEDVHEYWALLDGKVTGKAAQSLDKIFDRASRELAESRSLFYGLANPLTADPAQLVKAGEVMARMQTNIDRLVKRTGQQWVNDTMPEAIKAGYEMTRKNLINVQGVDQDLVRAALTNVSRAEKGVLRVGYQEAYQIMDTVGDDIGQWMTKTLTDAQIEGIPIQALGNGDSLERRLYESGRLKSQTIRTASGRIIRRSIRQRAQAIARVETNRMINRMHQVKGDEALGGEALWKDSGPIDDRTTEICMRASGRAPQSKEAWAKGDGLPPRIGEQFHLCRHFLLATLPEWEDAEVTAARQRSIEKVKAFKKDQLGGKLPKKPGAKKVEPGKKPAPAPKKPAQKPAVDDDRPEIQARIEDSQHLEGQRGKVLELGRKHPSLQEDIESLTGRIEAQEQIASDTYDEWEKVKKSASTDILNNLQVKNHAAHAEIKRLKEKLDKSQQVMSKRVVKALGTEGQGVRALEFQDGGGVYKVNAEKGMEFVGDLLKVDEAVPIVFQQTKGRSYHKGIHKTNGKGYSINKNNPKRGVSLAVHEQGHAVEEWVSGVHERVKEFRAYREGNESTQKLRDLFPGSGYDAEEIARGDHWDRGWRGAGQSGERLKRSQFYTGKVYDHANSEIISMGLQLLYENPVGFAIGDPEFFKFIVGIMDGSIR